MMIQPGFRASAEGRPLHVHVSSAVVNAGSTRLGRLQEQLAQLLADRLGKGYVRHHTLTKERVFEVPLGSIHKLIHQNDVTGPVLRLQGAHRTHTDDPGHVERLQGPEVGPMIQFARKQPVPPRVAGQEDHFPSRQFPAQKLIRGCAKGSFDRAPLLPGETIHVVQTRATNNANAR